MATNAIVSPTQRPVSEIAPEKAPTATTAATLRAARDACDTSEHVCPDDADKATSLSHIAAPRHQPARHSMASTFDAATRAMQESL